MAAATMVDWSLILAVLMVSLLGGALTGAVALVIGGLGVTRGMARRLGKLEDQTERTDDRITREVKTRAGLAAVAKRSDADVKREAEALLSGNTQPSAERRPSVINLGR